eukprot:TRINITY_DN5650_c0_g1_i1.p1 TRINITY_DN5650_c0_g1~~TRINITY_DN5650_c0_g1_i1.p1  ORF type:complete len:147 (-),score=38.99 TRINITY_DN5650_c0_g1_i1:558-998(-)
MDTSQFLNHTTKKLENIVKAAEELERQGEHEKAAELYAQFTDMDAMRLSDLENGALMPIDPDLTIDENEIVSKNLHHQMTTNQETEWIKEQKKRAELQNTWAAFFVRNMDFLFAIIGSVGLIVIFCLMSWYLQNAENEDGLLSKEL